jgi:micrococcal nuclease
MKVEGHFKHDTGMSLLSILAAGAFCTSWSVHDGDSIRCGGERIRIANIDAPELPGSPRCSEERRAKAWCDYEAGYRARDALQAFLKRGPVLIERIGPDKYGRTLARVSVNGEDAGAYLVELGLARLWR